MLLFSASFFPLAPESGGLRVKEETKNSARKPPDGGFFYA